VKTTSIQIAVSKNLGSVSAEIIEPETKKAILTLAHGAGAGMNHFFMVSLAQELARLGIATLRYNFVYVEQRKKMPDLPAIAHKAVGAAIDKTHELFPDVPLFVSGKSFGGRMSSQYLTKSTPDWIKGIIFFGFPLHPAGKPLVERAEHLKTLTLPMLFLQGTKDELAELSLIEKVTSKLPSATLHTLEGTDHAFKFGKQDFIPVLAQVTHDWVIKNLG
jgi:uncharacterized protein